MSDTNQKSTAEAEREVEEARADLQGSIDDLQNRLSPEALIDQTVAYFRGDGRHHVDAVGREVRENPLPVILVGIGLAWMAIGVSRRSRRDEAIRAHARNEFYRTHPTGVDVETASTRNVEPTTPVGISPKAHENG